MSERTSVNSRKTRKHGNCNNGWLAVLSSVYGHDGSHTVYRAALSVQRVRKLTGHKPVFSRIKTSDVAVAARRQRDKLAPRWMAPTGVRPPSQSIAHPPYTCWRKYIILSYDGITCAVLGEVHRGRHAKIFGVHEPKQTAKATFRPTKYEQRHEYGST